MTARVTVRQRAQGGASSGRAAAMYEKKSSRLVVEAEEEEELVGERELRAEVMVACAPGVWLVT